MLLKTLCCAVACVLVASIAQAGLHLAQEGKSAYVIVVADDAIPAENTAARELHDHLKQVTGADLPVLRESDLAGADGPRILVGQTKLARQMLPDVKCDALGYDGIVIKTIGENLVLAGGRPRGALYAVNSFLEDSVGVRWWTNSESTIPHAPTLDVTPRDVQYVPKFRYREVFNLDALYGHYPFASRLKLNGQHNHIPDSHGGHYTIIGWCHTSFDLMPPNTYFAKHPEWFALINGKRQTATQLCASDETMWPEMAKNALARVRENPSAGIISVSQMDGAGACECERCRKMVAEEGSEDAPWIRMANYVAAEINKEYPDFLVETLAYYYTRKPPKLARPSKNVLVRLCSIEANFAHSLSSEPNKTFGDDLRRWSEIAPNLFIWNYVTNFHAYLIPHPNLTSLGEDLRFFQDHNVVGVFQQGDAFNPKVGDFLPLRTWVQAKLLWDPSLDQQKLQDEFLAGYYGAAGPHLGKYLELVNAPTKDPKLVIGCGNTSTAFLSDDAIVQATDQFDKAQAAVASQPEILKRVTRERLALDHVRLLRTKSDVSLKDYEKRARQWVADARELGVANASEMSGFDSYAPTVIYRLRRLVPTKIPPAGAVLPEGAFDIQEDRFSLHRRGEISELVSDPKASNGKAARMDGGTTDWAVQFSVPADAKFVGPGPWNCWIVARVDVKKATDIGFLFGLHDPTTGRVVALERARLEKGFDSEYHTFSIIVDELKPSMYLWVAPTGDGAAIGNVYVDRIYIEKQSTADRD